jgi:hypothetical protein
MTDTALYVAAQRWSRPLLDALEGRATGVILGDLFCQKRMFENEWFDIFDFARRARSLGLDVVFQTPAYNTTRTMEQTVSLARKLAGESLLDAALVHDVGVAEALAEFEAVGLWWDRFAFNRDIVPSAYLVDFLLEHRVSRVELVRASQVGEVAGRGCGALLYAYGPEVASFGRVCYTEYFLDEPCERKILCGSRRPFIASADKVPLQYLADGYTLLDRSDPVHTLPRLDASAASQVSGLTAYVRGEHELEELSRAVEEFRGMKGVVSGDA